MKIHPNIAVVLTLLVITLAIYARTAYFPFCEIDDRDYVSENVQVLSGLSADSITWAFSTVHASNWHPVTWLSLMIDSQLFGTDPMGYHLVNVTFHAISAALLFLFFNMATGTLWRSAFVAACFALHPLHVESVAWISERKDVLSAFFLMLTLIFYSEYVRKSKRSMYILSLAAFALGLMAKPMLVTVPVVLLLLDIWPFERMKKSLLARVNQSNNTSHDFKFLLTEKIPYLVLSAASSAITVYAQSHGGAVISIEKFPMLLRVNNALWSIISYIIKTLYPFNLAIFYPIVPVPLWNVVCAVIIISAIMYISVRKIRDYPWLATGWLWYLITLLPVIGLIQVGGQAMADRYTYIPHIGLFVMASWGGTKLWEKLPKLRKVINVSAVGILLFFSIATLSQLSYWQDNIMLLTHTIGITKDNYLASYTLGSAYEREGEKKLAIVQYNDAIRSYPGNPELHLLHFHLGNMLNDMGDSNGALGHFAETIKLKPQFWQAPYNMGLTLEKLGRLTEALRYYNDTLKIKPDDAPSHNNIGRLLAKQGHLDEAIQHFSMALQLDPTLEQARSNLQHAHVQKSQPVK